MNSLSWTVGCMSWLNSGTYGNSNLKENETQVDTMMTIRSEISIFQTAKVAKIIFGSDLSIWKMIKVSKVTKTAKIVRTSQFDWFHFFYSGWMCFYETPNISWNRSRIMQQHCFPNIPSSQLMNTLFSSSSQDTAFLHLKKNAPTKSLKKEKKKKHHSVKKKQSRNRKEKRKTMGKSIIMNLLNKRLIKT